MRCEHRHERLLDLLVQALQRRNALDLRPQRLVQAQRHVGIFGGILRGALDRHLAEADLLCAFAGDILVGDGAASEITSAGGVHVMPRGPHAVPDVGLEHGVITHAGQPDAVVLQHVDVVLEVMTEFRLLRVLEHGLQRLEYAGAIELRRRARIVVSQRQIRGRAGLDAEGEPDYLRAHVVEARRLGVEHDQLRAAQLREPALEVLPASQSLIVSHDFLRRCLRGRIRGRHCRSAAAAAAPAAGAGVPGEVD